MNNDMEYSVSSPVIAPGERWDVEIHTFGTYPYGCTLHPEERGVIIIDDM
jgi:hypothetical protein